MSTDLKPIKFSDSTSVDSNKSVYTEVVAALEAAHEKSMQLLTTEGHNNARMFLASKMMQVINRMRFLGGMPIKSGEEKMGILSPLKEFMGEKIEKTEENQVILTEKEQRIKNLNKKADKLFEDLPSLSNEEVLESYTLEDDILAIRVLAKRTGLPNYRDGVINSKFLDELRSELASIAELSDNQSRKEKLIASLGNENLDQ